MDNPVITALAKRRSIRSYKPEQITDDELKTVLEAGPCKYDQLKKKIDKYILEHK